MTRAERNTTLKVEPKVSRMLLVDTLLLAEIHRTQEVLMVLKVIGRGHLAPGGTSASREPSGLFSLIRETTFKATKPTKLNTSNLHQGDQAEVGSR